MIVTLVAAAAAFNLVCTGPSSGSPGMVGRLGPLLPAFDVDITYRVDLDKGRYCEDACTETHPLAKVSDAEIVFTDSYSDTESRLVIKVDRESGAFSRIGKSKDITYTQLGRCTRQPFSGFPAG